MADLPGVQTGMAPRQTGEEAPPEIPDIPKHRSDELLRGLQEYDRDFWNRGTGERRKIIMDYVDAAGLVPGLRDMSEGARWMVSNKVLEAVGADSSYSLGEAAYDFGTGMPGAVYGGKLGHKIAGPIGAAVGGGVGAFITRLPSEALKATFERIQHNIPVGYEEVVKHAFPTAVEEGIMQLIAPGFSKAGQMTTRGALGGKKHILSESGRITQKVLKDVPPNILRKMGLKKGETLSLSAAGLNPEERGFLNFIEGAVSAAFGSSKYMNKFYNNNEKGVQALFWDILDSTSKNIPADEWTKKLDDISAGIVSPTKALRTHYYRGEGGLVPMLLNFDDQVGTKVDVSDFYTWMIESYGKGHRKDAKRIVSAVGEHLGINPKSVNAAAQSMEDLSAAEVKTLLQSVPTEISSTEAGSLVWLLNDLYDVKALRNTAQHAKGLVESPLIRTLKNSGTELGKETADKWTFAKEFFKKSAEAYDDTLVPMMMKQIGENNPNAVVKYVTSKDKALPNLRSFKKAYQWATDHPEISKIPGKAPTKQVTMKDYKTQILEPSRYAFIYKSVDADGRFDGKALLQSMQDRGATFIEGKPPTPGPYFDELFMDDLKLFETFHELAVAEAHTRLRPGGEQVWIKFVQAGILTQLAMGGGLDPVPMGAVVLGPIGVARMLTNKKALRIATDGLKAGGGTMPYSRAIVMAGRLNSEKIEDFTKKLPPALIDYYSGFNNLMQEWTKEYEEWARKLELATGGQPR